MHTEVVLWKPHIQLFSQKHKVVQESSLAPKMVVMNGTNILSSQLMDSDADSRCTDSELTQIRGHSTGVHYSHPLSVRADVPKLSRDIDILFVDCGMRAKGMWLVSS